METNSFRLSLDMILDESKQYRYMMSETYYINEESLIDQIIKFDFKKIFKFILDKFLTVIKIVWDQFRAAYHSFVTKSILIKQYKKKLENITWDIEINEEYPIFMNLDNSTNISMYNMSLNSEYSTLIQKLEDISQCKNIGDIHTIILNIKDSTDYSDNYLDQQRGMSLGSNSAISKEAYAQEVFRHFCPNKTTINILSASEIKQMTKEYFEFKTLEKVITKNEFTLRSSAESMIGKINNISIEKYCPSQIINKDVSEALLDIIRLSCDRVHGLCDIYIQLFSIKLDSFKLYKQQQVKLLTKVILQSIKEGKM